VPGLRLYKGEKSICGILVKKKTITRPCKKGLMTFFCLLLRRIGEIMTGTLDEIIKDPSGTFPCDSQSRSRNDAKGF